MSRRAGRLLAAAIVVVAAVAATLAVAPWRSEERAELVASAWVPLWEPRAAASLRDAVETGGVSEISPTWAHVREDGGLDLTPPPPRTRLAMVHAGVRLIPVVQNFDDGAWQGERTARLLADPAQADRHRAALVQAALDGGWHGIDIDYEQLPPTAGQDFADFLTALGEDLDRHDLVLSVAVPARADDEDRGTLAYSYQVIGQAADQVRVMAYDNSWSGSTAGPVAPVDWVRDVVGYAAARVPAAKLMLGVPAYGYDWTGTTGEYLPTTDVVALAERVGATPRWDDAAGSMTFDYTDDQGRAHTVWYEDARSVGVKQQIAVEAGIRGIAVWALGGEDPAMWSVVAERSRP